MDSVTQIILGASVGEAVLGKEEKNKAVLWGAIGGLIPDLDVFVARFASPVNQLLLHRSFSHSILFFILASPLLAWLTQKIYKDKISSSFKKISLLFFLTLLTHSLLDCLTTYGTRLFFPFSLRVSIPSVSVVDPIYTIPFAALLLAVLFIRRNQKLRSLLNWLALGISTAYLIFTLGNKLYIRSIFSSNLSNQNIKYTRIFTAPTLLNNILWMGVAENKEAYYIGYYSYFDQDKKITFTKVEKNKKIPKSLLENKDFKSLQFFSKGLYAVVKQSEISYLFKDLRYSSLDANPKSNNIIFAFLLEKQDNGKWLVKRKPRLIQFKNKLISNYFNRIFGIKNN